MKVVELKNHNLVDVPLNLRKLAGQMEDGTVPASLHCIVISEDADGEISVYGYGEIGTRANEVGLLQMAAIQLATT